MDIIEGKMSYGLLRLSRLYHATAQQEKTFTLFCRGKRCVFVLYFLNGAGQSARQGERIQQADYY
ncbi:MAG: hypothetical protein KAT01_03310 [Candidatus Aminicenantes bacterium]|jgi:hypothetical protein|nr:hypothetical protein [Candidatus Aminicenantes bacterium]